ncbi:DUF2130 domain-containing protein [Chryseolinea sp. H1M3-3]|uniref:DUF2130 domain-containing protein n=1 Tax=Chryseolinea sp. H1M3-3 TaxID=3034144 RepID=UPI0023EBEE52|nr:DUF2130 domain-containing protein [Chryseolinea sp. H1M3-3]
MEMLNHIAVMVKCPHCGNKFSPEEAIQHDLRAQLEKEFDQKLQANTKNLIAKIQQEEQAKYKTHLQRIEEDRKAKASRVKELEDQSFILQEREQKLRDREERIEHEMKKRLFEREKLIREQADKHALEKALLEVREREAKIQRERETLDLILKKRVMEETDKAREEERMKNAELQKKLDDQSRMINEMKRKTEQGSMQTQGEVQELAIEEYLSSSFPRDVIEEITKGKRGADCVHIVRDHYDNECGRILYESKRTKHFSYEWIPKMKDDMRLKQADIGVIVTETLPEGKPRFCEVDGVWVCTFAEFKALALLFRHNLSRIGEVLSAQENKGEKMNLIYRYVTGNDFKQKLEAAFESYHDMQEDLQKEKTLFTSQWAKREKRLLKAMENLVCLYGDVRGIAGGAVQEIKALELPEIKLLMEE